jgi:hypothetical protein
MGYNANQIAFIGEYFVQDFSVRKLSLLQIKCYSVIINQNIGTSSCALLSAAKMVAGTQRGRLWGYPKPATTACATTQQATRPICIVPGVNPQTIAAVLATRRGEANQVTKSHRSSAGPASLIPVWVKRNKPRSTDTMTMHVNRFIAHAGEDVFALVWPAATAL